MSIIKVSSIGATTAKGNCTIKCSITSGFATSSSPRFIFSNPEAIKLMGVKVGDDITEAVKGFVERTSEFEGEDGNTVSCIWLEPTV